MDFAMIRVGYRGNEKGQIVLDSKFVENITGATEAGIPVGVYFYSKAISNEEAEEEATFVLEQIQTYQVTYPIAIFWEYDYNDDGTKDQSLPHDPVQRGADYRVYQRLLQQGEDGRPHPCYYAAKSFAYEDLDLSQLANYDMWYAEYASVPGFYYDFAMWQYTQEGSVPGISGSVPITLSLKQYG